MPGEQAIRARASGSANSSHSHARTDTGREGASKSAPARVTRHGGRYTITGAAWGAPVARVEVRVDNGPWRAAKLDRRPHTFAWTFWTFAWGSPTSGEHTITSRAFDESGAMQPAPTDPSVADRRTYWENNGQITRRVAIP